MTSLARISFLMRYAFSALAIGLSLCWPPVITLTKSSPVIEPILEPVQDQQDEEKMTRRELMRMKLMYSQNIVEGLTTKRFSLISEATQHLKDLTFVEAWESGRRGEIYANDSRGMRESADRLAQAANRMDTDAATLRYLELTISCINCHQHLGQNDF